jgi:hypothetical protein
MAPGRGGGGDWRDRQRGEGMRRDARGGMPGGGGDRDNRDRPAPYFEPLSDEEFVRAIDFMRESMPNAYGIWQRLPEPMRNRRMLPPRLLAAFRLMFDAQERNDQALNDLLVRQLKLRDEFLGELIEHKDETVQQMKAALRDKTREIVDANLEQRDLRLRQMEQRLDQERDRLNKDREDPDAMIEAQMHTMWEDSRRFLRMYNMQNEGGRGPTTQPGVQAFPSDKPSRD